MDGTLSPVRNMFQSASPKTSSDALPPFSTEPFTLPGLEATLRRVEISGPDRPAYELVADDQPLALVRAGHRGVHWETIFPEHLSYMNQRFCSADNVAICERAIVRAYREAIADWTLKNGVAANCASPADAATECLFALRRYCLESLPGVVASDPTLRAIIVQANEILAPHPTGLTSAPEGIGGTNNIESVSPAFAIRIDETGLASRPRNALWNERAIFLGDVCGLTEPELRRIPNCGAKSVGYITDMLSRHGLSLGMHRRDALDQWVKNRNRFLSAEERRQPSPRWILEKFDPSLRD